MPEVVFRCPRCGKKIPEKDAPCVCETAPAAVVTNTEKAPAPKATPAKARSKGRRSPARLVALIVVAIAGAAVLAWTYMPMWRYPGDIQLARWQPGADVATSPDDPCVGRSRCVVAYLVGGDIPSSVWAMSDLPKLRQAAKDPERPGVRVIVGSGDAAKERVDALIRLVGDPVYLDPTGDFLSHLKMESVPGLFVVDDKNHVQESGRGARAWITKELADHP